MTDLAVLAVTQRSSRIVGGVKVDFVLDVAAVAGASEVEHVGQRLFCEVSPV
jgi:hypothetical protein